MSIGVGKAITARSLWHRLNALYEIEEVRTVSKTPLISPRFVHGDASMICATVSRLSGQRSSSADGLNASSLGIAAARTL